MMSTPNSTRILEILAVTLTGFGKFVFVDIYNFKIWYILVACISWMIYIGYRVRHDPDILDYFGFRRHGFSESLKIILPLALVALGAFIAIGLITDNLIVSWTMVPILILYPIWGTIQQFLMVGLIARNLMDLDNVKVSNFWVVAIISILFSTVHYPSFELIAGTFLLAILYTIVFIRYRNLWVLGLFHGWLGCFFYFFVLGRDPLNELFQSM